MADIDKQARRIKPLEALSNDDENNVNDKTYLLDSHDHEAEENYLDGILTAKDGTLSIDDIVNSSVVGLFHIFVTISCGLCYSTATIILNAYSSFIVAACDLHITISNSSWVGSSLSIGMMIGSLVLGIVSDYIGRRKTILISVSCNIIIMIVSAFSYNYLMAALLAFLNGFCLGGVITSCHPYMVEFLPKRYRGLSVPCMTSFVIFGNIYCNVTGFLILPFRFYYSIGEIYFTSWRLHFIICTVPMLIGILSLLFLPNSLRFTLKRGNTIQVVQIFNQI
ncbi:uncharacterized protein TRIADDRAFT_31425, partial [Trichoplax adhaerens]